MADNVQIKGIGSLLKKFKNFADEIKIEAQQELVASCMSELETTAKEKLTQDGHIDTGRLRASIFTKTKDNRVHRYSDQEGKSYTCDLSKAVKELQVVVGTNVEYAIKIERMDSFIQYAFRQGSPQVIKNMDKLLERMCRKYG